MDKDKMTVTVYRKTTNQLLLQSINSSKSNYENMGIYSINLGQSRNRFLEHLFKYDIRWLEFVLARNSNVEQQIQLQFAELEKWLNNWRSSGCQNDKARECDAYIRNCYIQLLAVLIFRYEGEISSEVKQNDEIIRENYNKALPIASQVYDAYQGDSLANMVYKGKCDYLQSYFWPPLQSEWAFNDFINELNRHFYLFMMQGINKIFLSEIKKKMGIRDIIPKSRLQDFFRFIIGSFDQFRRFVNRNYLYSLINDGFNECGVDYDILRDIQDENRKYKIIITRSNYANYEGKEYFITHQGIPASSRFIEDHVITLGRESYEEFDNDISLPNTRDLDSIFAVIFINRNGLNLIDISEKSTVKIKIKPDETIELIHDMIIVLGKNHQIHVKIEKGLNIAGNSKILRLSDFEDCKTVKTINRVEVKSREKISLGSDNGNSFIIKAEDIDPIHAFIENINDRFYITDNHTRNGSFYRLKTGTQVNQGKPSNMITLKNQDVFLVKFFYFLVMEETKEN